MIINPRAHFNRPADVADYGINDLVANSAQADAVMAMSFPIGVGARFSITRARFHKSGTEVANASFRLHLFADAPSVSNGDNGAFLPTIANYLGAVDVVSMAAFSDGAAGCGLPAVGGTISVDLGAGAVIYGLQEARAPYVPAADELFSWTLEAHKE